MPTSSVRSCNAPRNFWFSAVFSFNWVNTEGHRCKRSAAIRKRVLSCRGRFKFSIKISRSQTRNRHLRSFTLPNHFKDWACASEPSSQDVIFGKYSYICMCLFLVCEPKRIKRDLQKPLQTGEGKEQSRHKGDVSNQSGEMSLWLLQPSALIG